MRSVLLALVVLALVRSAHAQPPPPRADEHAATPTVEELQLGYDAALALLDDAPELRARALGARQLRAARSQVGALPSDLSLSLEAGPRIDPALAAQGRVAISQSFALSALGEARRHVLDSQALALDLEHLSRRLARRLVVTAAWLRVHYAHAALHVTQAERALADELAHVAARGATLSELTRVDAADAAAYAAEAQLGVLAAEGELTDARLDLTRALAISNHVLDTRGDTPHVREPTAAQEQQLHARLERDPALLLLLRRAAALDARARELRATHASQLSLGVVLDRTDPKAWATLGMVGLTWPLEERARRERAELDAERTTLLGEWAEQRAESHVEVERLFHDITHSRETLQYADEQLLPAVERGLSARDALFRSGEGTVLELILARRSALGLRIRRQRLESEWLAALLRFRELALAVGLTP